MPVCNFVGADPNIGDKKIFEDSLPGKFVNIAVEDFYNNGCKKFNFRSFYTIGVGATHVKIFSGNDPSGVKTCRE